MKHLIEDVQGRPDERNLVVERAGVCGLKHPFTLETGSAGGQPVLAELALSCLVPAAVKGTHMSRFVEAARDMDGILSAAGIVELARDVQKRLQSEDVTVTAAFPFLLMREAPVTRAQGYVDYRGELTCQITKGAPYVTSTVHVAVTSLCPCSKAISDYGAHNQRGIITISVRHSEPLPLEELVAVAEGSGSCPVYSVLKRPDERAVTMRAYETPMFVEDMVRNVAASLASDKRILGGTVKAVNEESIHNHQAFAELTL